MASKFTRFRGPRQRLAPIILASCFMMLNAGCDDGLTGGQSSMPSKEFVEKLVKEHPELFVRKVGKGKKTEKIEGRDKREIIREEWYKAQQQGAQ